MAKLDRNRTIFFGSFTGGSPVAEQATASIGDSTGITKAVVVAATFGTKVASASDEYVFTYDGTNWKLDGISADVTTDYGITLTGEPVKNDIIVVDYSSEISQGEGWEALGKDTDDLSKDLNPDIETSKNVLGEATAVHMGYEPEVNLDPYYIDPARRMYAKVRKAAIEELYGEADILGWFAEAFFDTVNRETRKMTGKAYVRKAKYVPLSTGGDTSGYAIPVTIHPEGAMAVKNVEYDMTTNEAKITDIT